ncbi:MAG: 7TM diverse intracellular signaling domain-containing protein [Bacteroidota bacterium]
MRKCFYYFGFFVLQFILVQAQEKNDPLVIYSVAHHSLLIGRSVLILEDKDDKFSLNDVVISKDFVNSNKPVPDLGISNSAFWIKVKIQNNTDNKKLLFELSNPMIDEVELFSVLNGSVSVKKMSEYRSFDLRSYDYPSYVFDLDIPKGDTASIYLKIKGKEQIFVPLKLGSQRVIINSLSYLNLLFGMYVGIMLAMFFYNAFIYFTTKDPNYLYYIIYILFVALTQSYFQGYCSHYLWNNSPWIGEHSFALLGAFVGISAAEFAKSFLNFAEHLKFFKNILYVFYLSYFVCIVFSILGWSYVHLLDITALSVSLYLLIVAIIIARKGYRPAKFFLIAWSVFLMGVIVFALRNEGLLPYDNITNYTMPAGSAIEAILLSFALADRINILKKEKEESQRRMLEALLENEILIRKQNIVLGQKIDERTVELKHTNEELTNTLTNLKNAQTQLVTIEKMASLGQLTAGIAHEINNPINFVTANIKPLKVDIDDILELISKYEKIEANDSEAKFKVTEDFKKSIDYEYLKKEMAELLSGIEEGAKRTAEIVKGLKNFSRLDENDIKTVNINDGIESTLMLLKNTIPDDVELNVSLGNISKIDCLPGKLNQVFMNLLNNAVYALNKAENKKQKKLIVQTFEENDHIYLLIEDTGIGMSPEVKANIFDPFFTTKDVGEGTGLGMSIVFKIIETHQARIQIESEAGCGTKVLLILNKKINLY